MAFRVLMLSRDRSGLDPQSATAERWRLLRDAGVELDVLITSPATTSRSEEWITVTGTGGANPLSRLLALYQLAQVRIANVNIVTAQDPFELGWVAQRLARAAGKKCEVQDHGGFFDGAPADEPLWALRSLLARFVARRADQIRTVSPKSLDVLRDGPLGDRAYFLPVAAQMRFMTVVREPDPDLCATVGRLVSVKRVDLLLRTFALLRQVRPTARLVIVGDGPERDRLVALASRLDLATAVEFVGAADPAPWLAKASVFALVSAHEGWGVAAVEAALAGVPVVMSDTGCARWLEARGRADAVSSKDPKVIAQHLLSQMGATGVPGLFDGAIGQKETANRQVEAWRRLVDRVQIVVCAQAVDADDPLFGFFISWLVEAAKQFEKVTVFALRVGRYDLPSNVRVLPLRPMASRSRLLVVWNLFRYSWKERLQYDGVFVRGDAQYVVLAGWLWRLLRKPVIFWYAHYSARSWWVTLAARMASLNVTSVAAAEIGPAAMKIGQAINTDQFPEGHQHERMEATALVFGRISPVKRVPWMLEELARAEAQECDSSRCVQRVRIVGRATQSHEQEALRACVQRAGAQWEERDVANADAPALYQAVDVLLNATPGSLDKTIVEAMLSGLVVVASTPGYGEMLPRDLSWLNPSDAQFGDAAVRAMRLRPEERQMIADRLRTIAADRHGQRGQIERLHRLFVEGRL